MRLGHTRARLLRVVAVLAFGGLIAAVVVLAARPGVTRVDAPQLDRHARAPQQPPGYLFVTDAHAGTLVPAPSKAGEYVLTLTGVHPSATYFLDRPGNEVGVVSVPQLMAALFHKSGETRPNAVVNAIVPSRGHHQYAMGVALLGAHYVARTHTLVYRVRQLKQGPESRRERGRTDVVLPRSFSHTSVFIDTFETTCLGAVENVTNVPLPQESWPNNVGKWSTDFWSPYPADTIGAASTQDQVNGSAGVGDSAYLQYGSSGTIGRGCHNWINLTYPGGTIQVSLEDPSSGSNTATCDVNESDSDYQFRCGYRIGPSVVGGDNMNVDFVICSTNAAYQAQNSSAPAPNDGCSAVDAGSDGDGGMYWFTP